MNPYRRQRIRRHRTRSSAQLILALSTLMLATRGQSQPAAAPRQPAVAPRHLAVGMPAAQSSVLEQAAADRAVDGTTDGRSENGSLALTHRDPYPYWWVDLGKPTRVGSVIVHGRTDDHADRLDHFILIGLPEGVSPATEPLLSTLARKQLAEPDFAPEGWTIHRSERQFTAEDASEEVELEGSFRYLYIVLPRADYLQLAEVEVLPPAKVDEGVTAKPESR